MKNVQVISGKQLFTNYQAKAAEERRIEEERKLEAEKTKNLWRLEFQTLVQTFPFDLLNAKIIELFNEQVNKKNWTERNGNLFTDCIVVYISAEDMKEIFTLTENYGLRNVVHLLLEREFRATDFKINDIVVYCDEDDYDPVCLICEFKGVTCWVPEKPLFESVCNEGKDT
jgi:hypothetical protein